jgi:hypothetical protein
MLLQIVAHTPPWVWGLLVALIALGVWQGRPRSVSVSRVVVLPLILLALSLAGVVSTFAADLPALVAWALGVVVAFGIGRQVVGTRGARWDAAASLLHVPGSWLPLVLILLLFSLEYSVGVALALQPGLARNTGFDAAVGAAYGGFSGFFLARAAALWQLARRPAPAGRARASAGPESAA